MQRIACQANGSHFISGLSKTEVQRLDSLGKKIVFEENDLMVVEGERSTMFYLLLSGNASVEVSTGFCTIFIQELSAGDAFGWTSLLQQHDTMFQVRARERSTALRLDGAAVNALCREEPELGVMLLTRVLQTVAGRVRGLEMRLGEFCGFTRETSTSTG